MTVEKLEQAWSLKREIEELKELIARENIEIDEAHTCLLWDECTRKKFTIPLTKNEDSELIRDIFRRTARIRVKELSDLEDQFAKL